jgi:hypothetical protein
VAKYLFGDASPSPLDRNYIELLKAIIDFSVEVLKGDALAAEGKKRTDKRRAAADRELELLKLVAERMTNTLDQFGSPNDSPVAAKALQTIRASVNNQLTQAKAEIQGGMRGEVAKITEAVNRERAGNLKRLEKLLLKHELPHSTHWVNLRLANEESYAAELVGKASLEVAWVIELAVPPDHAFSELVRLEKLIPDLTLMVPEMAGWVRKSVKLKSHKVSRDYITFVGNRGGRTTIKIRSTPSDADNGFDVVFSSDAKKIVVTPVAKGEPKQPFEPTTEDSETLRSLRSDVNERLEALAGNRRALREARLDGKPLQDHPEPSVLVRRLIDQLAPVVQEIAKRSLSPTEFVLKRVVGDDRREEIFASKADLREKIMPLPPELRRLFMPLALGELDLMKGHDEDATELRPNPPPLPPTPSVPPAAGVPARPSGPPPMPGASAPPPPVTGSSPSAAPRAVTPPPMPAVPQAPATPSSSPGSGAVQAAAAQAAAAQAAAQAAAAQATAPRAGPPRLPTPSAPVPGRGQRPNLGGPSPDDSVEIEVDD